MIVLLVGKLAVLMIVGLNLNPGSMRPLTSSPMTNSDLR